MKQLAWSVLAVAACGGGSSGSPDASTPPADAAAIADAMPADASTRGPVTVTARNEGGADEGAPEAGVTILFHDARGALVSRQVTDANGLASADIDVGASVTRIETGRLETIADVAPGDHLVFGPSPALSPMYSANPFLLTVPADTGAYVYLSAGPGFWNAVGGAPGTIENWYLNGFDQTTGDVVVEADFNTPTTHKEYLIARGVAVSHATQQVSVSGTWHAPATFSVAVANAPATTTVSADHALYTGGFFLYESGATDFAATAAGSATIPLPSPGVAGDAQDVTLTAKRTDRLGAIRVKERVTPGPSTATIDLAQIALPWWSAAPVATATGVTWAAPTTSGAASATVLTMWATGGISWTITVPADRASFTLPTLPTDLASTWPGDKDGPVTVDGSFIALDGAPWASAHLDPYALRYGAFTGTSGRRVASSTVVPSP